MLTSPDRGIASFGKYRFLAEIGFGGMSEIYLTVTQGGLAGFQKLVALKLLRSDLAEDAEFRRMFLDEARLAARLNHPNVVQTYDVGEDHGRYYIAMEYLEGQSFERIRRAAGSGRRFPLELQIRMLSQVLCGLHHAHAFADYDDTTISIVHRDVTPSNVLVTYDGQVKLIDFGIAKVLDWVHDTQVGVLKGKARYMAPEQVSGAPIDRRADLYSVGVMLWETLAGQHIWSGLSGAEVIKRSGQPPPPPPDAPAMLQQICSKAMAPRPEDRYPTAEALRADLELFLAQHITPSRERDMGAAVTELFGDERARIRQVIDAQLKGSGPGDRLPAFRELRSAPSGTPFDTPMASNPYLRATGASGSEPGPAALDDADAGPHSEQLPAPAGYPPSSRRRLYAIAGGAVLIAAVAVALTRGGGRPPPAGAPGPATAPLIRPEALSPPPRPPVVVRGATDDTITLGMTAAFSGASRELGNRMKLGLDTAFAAVNDAGGVAGRRIHLLALDDGYEGPHALANARELIEDRKVFALIGDVGTPTTQQALPYVLASRTILFGAFTGAGLLRRDPPDRYVFNYRASYEEETARMIDYLIDVRKVPDGGIAVFAQNDSYGDAGFDGAAKRLRGKGRDDQLLRIGYERNTLDVDAAVARLVESSAHHPVKAIVLVATYKAASRFIQRIRDRKIDALLLNVSFVGSNALAEELKELGPGYAKGVIVTQVVPHYESSATGVLRYRDALARYHPDQQPDFVSLEGFLVGQLFSEALRRAGRELDTEKLVDALEQLRTVDLGVGGELGFSPSQHQASHRVWMTQLDEHGAFHSIDIQ
ncbi:MAG TPA: ABC transporter substrate-binding protein [Kofleriaceae bacterium]|jgi:serine/threonine protein kinase/ABC-type branched-subunit amino acid transport system substrate-binding protein|nr:ABC transporter substrate-binding protein [Kofleriaceae bacterium]